MEKSGFLEESPKSLEQKKRVQTSEKDLGLSEPMGDPANPSFMSVEMVRWLVKPSKELFLEPTGMQKNSIEDCIDTREMGEEDTRDAQPEDSLMTKRDPMLSPAQPPMNHSDAARIPAAVETLTEEKMPSGRLQLNPHSLLEPGSFWSANCR